MHTEEQSRGRRGPAVLVALLLSLLLGSGPAAALSDLGPSAISQSENRKATALSRSLRREVWEEADLLDPPSASGEAPAVETALPSFRPVTGNSTAPAAPRTSGRPSPFRARAPPAA